MIKLEYIAQFAKPFKSVFLDGYIRVYKRYFSNIRYKKIKLLEIGVYNGGSVKMWKNYFPFAKITGIDIDKRCEKYQSKRINIYIGDQADRDFLLELETKSGPFDIIIDDGGHTHNQQITSFKILFKLLNSRGMYIIEDIHTSYLSDKGYEKYFDYECTSIEYFKKLIDEINFGANNYNIDYIHFYPSIVIIKKK